MKSYYRSKEGHLLAVVGPGERLDMNTFHAAERAGGMGRAAPTLPFTPISARRPSLEDPTLAELALNFTNAMIRWQQAGFPTVPAETYQERTAACERCELWDGSARFGLGRCRAPGCGCTKYKRWLATERCRHPAGSRWAG